MQYTTCFVKIFNNDNWVTSLSYITFFLLFSNLNSYRYSLKRQHFTPILTWCSPVQVTLHIRPGERREEYTLHHCHKDHLCQGQNQARLSCCKNPPLSGSEPGKAFMLSGPTSVRVRTRQGFHVIMTQLYQGQNQARLSCYQDPPLSGSEPGKIFICYHLSHG